MNDGKDYTDDDLDRIYNAIVDADSASASAEVAGARKVLDILNRAVCPDTPFETACDLETVKAAPESTANELPLPAEVGRFRIRKKIGQGGFGMVLLADDPDLRRQVAIKIPRPEVFADDSLRQRFLSEGRIVASLTHPGIVPVFESGQIGPICYIASQYVSGQTLHEYLESGHEITPRESAALVAGLAEAIGHAHQRGVLHRDLKPANILIDEKEADRTLSERVQIADFGLAKSKFDPQQTQTGALIGTPAYMSPEQTLNAPNLEPTTDIYSLGAILYRLLTGVPPFSETTVVDVLNAVRDNEPRRVRSINKSVDKDLEAICLKCLEKKPTSRYSSSVELQADLNRYLNNRPVRARSIGTTTRMVRWCQRNPIPTAMVVLSVVSAITIGALLYRSEGLRNEAEKNGVAAEQQKQLALKQTQQIREAIKKLFQSVSDEPRLQFAEMEGFRKKLYVSASDFLGQLADDVPQDPKYLREHVNSLLEGARLMSGLGYAGEAIELLDKADGALLDRGDEFDILRYAIKSRRGELLFLCGDVKSALALKKEAVDFASQLQDSDPHFDEVLVKELRLASWVALSAGNQSQVEEYANRVEEILESVHGKPAMQWPATYEAACQLSTMANLAIGKSDFLRAEKLAARALELFVQLPGRNETEGALLNLAATQQKLGISYSYQNKMEQAVKLIGQAIGSVDRPRLSMTSKGLRSLSGMRYDLALCYYKTGELDEATDCLVESIADAELVAKNYPQSFDPMLKIKPMHLLYGVFAAKNDFEAAESQLRKAIEYAENAVADRPGHRTASIELGGMYSNFAALMSMTQRWEESDIWASKAFKWMEPLHKSRPTNVTAMHFLGAIVSKAAAAEKLGRKEQEFKHIKKYLEYAKHDERRAGMHRKLIFAYVGLGDFEDALKLARTQIDAAAEPRDKLDLAKNIARAVKEATENEAVPKRVADEFTEIALGLLQKLSSEQVFENLSDSLDHEYFDSIRDHEDFPQIQ